MVLVHLICNLYSFKSIFSEPHVCDPQLIKLIYDEYSTWPSIAWVLAFIEVVIEVVSIICCVWLYFLYCVDLYEPPIAGIVILLNPT